MDKKPEYLIVVSPDEKVMQECGYAPEREKDEKEKEVKYLTLEELRQSDYNIEVAPTGDMPVYIREKSGDVYIPFSVEEPQFDAFKNNILLWKALNLCSALEAMGAKKIRYEEQLVDRLETDFEGKISGSKGPIRAEVQAGRSRKNTDGLALRINRDLTPDATSKTIGEILEICRNRGVDREVCIMDFLVMLRENGYISKGVRTIEINAQSEMDSAYNSLVNISSLKVFKAGIEASYKSVQKQDLSFLLEVEF